MFIAGKTKLFPIIGQPVDDVFPPPKFDEVVRQVRKACRHVSNTDRWIQGGFNRSSQYLLKGVVDSRRKAQVGELNTALVVLAR